MDDEVRYRRYRAYKLRAAGASVNSICHELKCNRRFVKTWFERGRSGKGFADSQRSGAPRKLTPDLYPEVKRMLKQKKGGTAPKVAIKLKKSRGISITARTLENYGKELGLTSYVRPRKARLVKDDKPRRLRFCRRRRPSGFWNKVIWTDEKAYELHVEPNRIWAERRDDVSPIEKDLVEPTVRVWGGISASGKTKLFKIPSYWTAPEYVTHLKSKAFPSIRSMMGDDFVFMHDGDGAHRGRVVENFLAEEGVEVLDDFPARSGDLQPQENMWKIVDDGVKNRNFRSLDGLWKVLKEEWEKVPQETVANLAHSVPGRLRECIALGGGVTRH